ncbi:MAG: hypothetical protein M1819_006130 [Sarea resinae]|nr:MAG: hypothetical protein M1819_006130 [Sarea resinae]
MSLPAVKELADCADFGRTVAAYLPQLFGLPSQILEHLSSPADLKQIYLATNPFVSALALSLLLAPLFLVVSEINRNYSQVDRLWSLLPTLYNAHYVTWAHMAGLPTNRLDNLIAFSTIWSLRLTFNYWRKGGYSIGSEDYRWAIVKQKVPAAVFFIFNVVFISLIQSLLLMAITAPTYIMVLASRLTGDGFTTADLVFSRGLILLVIAELFADQQQWSFQQAKKQYQATAKVPVGYEQADLDRGFVVTGLWSFSRHPNFAAEQAIWALVYQWAVYTTDTYFNWTIVGAFSYLLLFQGSTWLTELISAQKYPEYTEYQQRVPKFLPKVSALFGADAVDDKTTLPPPPPPSSSSSSSVVGTTTEKEKKKASQKARRR